MSTSTMDPTSSGVTGTAAARSHDLAVYPGQRCRLRIDAVDPGGREGPRGLVGKLEFFDENGHLVAGDIEGSVRTDRHGAVAYLPTHAPDAAGPLLSENVLIVPAGAKRLHVQVRNWKCSPEVAILSPLELVTDREPALERFEFPVRAGLPHALELSLKGAVRHARAALLAFEFVDADGHTVPGPYDACISSPRFGPFRYLRATPEGAAATIPVLAPQGAVSVRLAIHPWKVALPALSMAAEQRFTLDVPEGLDADDWSLLSSVAWSRAHPLGFAGGGLLQVGLDCIGLQVPAGVAPAVQVGFVDAAGRPVAAPDVSADPPSITIESAEKLARRGGFFRCPADAHAVRFRLAPHEGHSLLVRHGIELRHVPLQRMSGEPLAPIGPGQSLDLRQAVSSLWQVRLELDGFAVNAGGRTLDVALALLDAAGKPVSPKGVLLEAAHATASIKGNVLSVLPHAMASGTQGVVRFTATVRILPPRGAVTLSAKALNPGTQGVAATLSVHAYDTLVGDRVVPECIPEILAMDERFPAKVCELAKEYERHHPQSPAVLTHLLDAYRRYGEIGKMEAVAHRALGLTGPNLSKLHVKARHALALVQELDPYWLPCAGLESPIANRRDGGPDLRVAHLFKTTVPVENTGGAIRCLNIVNFQSKLRMRPMVVTPLGYPDAGGTGRPWEREEIDGVPYYRLNGVGRQALRSVTSTTQLEFTAMVTARLLGEEGVDIVQASSGYRGYEQALVGLAVARALRVPFVYEVRSYHEHTWRGMTDWLLDAEHTQRRVEQENRCMREADAVVTICETMKQGLVERGIPADKVFVVPNSVDLEKFHEAPDAAELRNRLGLGGDLVAGYISNVSEREGHHVLLRAVALARESGTAMKCLVVGAGPELEKLRVLARHLGIAEHVVFTGEVPHEQIPAYYGAIDLFVIPRVADFASDFVTPMKPFEAMAMRRPLLVSDRPALLEIVGGDGQRGLVFRSGDHQHLADRLIELARSPEKRESLALEGRRWIENERSWDKTIRVYDQAYAFARQAAEKRHAVESAATQ